MTAKKYSTIDYQVLKELDVSPNELAYIDMVYYLSRSGTEWCYKSLQEIANDLNLSKSTIKNMRDRLLEKEILVRNDIGYVKPTEIVHKSYSVQKMHDRANFNPDRAKSARNRAKFDTDRAKFTPKNNNRITKNNIEKSLAEKYMDKYFPKRVVDMPDLGITYDR